MKPFSQNNMFSVVTVYIISMFTNSFREIGASLVRKAESTYIIQNYYKLCKFCVFCDIDCDIFN